MSFFGIRERRQRKNIIRYACNRLPEGICLAAGDGIPRMTNRKMQELVRKITGSHLGNVYTFLQEGENFTENAYCRRVEFSENLCIMDDENNVWNFCLRDLWVEDLKCLELLAIDVTAQYRLSLDLKEENERLRRQNAQLDGLMKNIVRLNQEEEILDSRIRVHYELGRTTMATRNYIDGVPGIDKQLLISLWTEVLNGLEGSFSRGEEDFDVKKELVNIAKYGNCNLVFLGDFDSTNEILTAAVREGLVNAVRHGHATLVIVESLWETEDGNTMLSTDAPHEKSRHVLLSIRDNGTGLGGNYTEGGGIRSLRQKISEAGGTMRLYSKNSENGTILEVHL